MKREWKPGDVALIPLGSADVRAMFTTDGWAISDMPGARGVREFSDVRPLVVIDPEDREQVERLLSAYWVERNPDDPGDARRYPGYVSDLQAALREFANPTPPKPEEPTGLGAVIVDAAGDKWLNYPGMFALPWSTAGRHSREYSDIDVVRVLSEGVTS